MPVVEMKTPSALPHLDHLGVAGYDRNARGAGGRPHAVGDALQISEWESPPR